MESCYSDMGYGSSQIITSLFINLLAFGSGAGFGLTNVLLTDFDISEDNNSTIESPRFASWANDSTLFAFKLHSGQLSWIATFAMVGQYFPIVFVGPIVSNFGKRASLMVDSALFIVGFALMALSANAEMIYAARFLQGYAYLTSKSSIQPFVCEISDPAVRKFTSTFWYLFFIAGQALCILGGTYCGWRFVSGLLVVGNTILLFGFLCIHETPYWLLENGHWEKARKSMEFYKIDADMVMAGDEKRLWKTDGRMDYAKLIEFYRKEHIIHRKLHETKKVATLHGAIENVTDNYQWCMTNIRKPEVHKPFLYLLVTFLLIELSGFAVLANYLIIILQKIGYGENTFVDAGTMASIVTITRIPISFLAIPVLQRSRRRPLYLFVCVSLLIWISGIMYFTYATDNGYLSQRQFQESTAMQIGLFALFILFYTGPSLGYGNIPSALMGELFPTNVSNVANLLIFTLVNSIELVVIKTTLYISDTFGVTGVFLINWIAIFASTIVGLLFMPETNGLSLKQISRIYSSSIGSESRDEEMPLITSSTKYFSHSVNMASQLSMTSSLLETSI